jgi:hypothetical protein
MAYATLYPQGRCTRHGPTFVVHMRGSVRSCRKELFEKVFLRTMFNTAGDKTG